MKLRDLSLFLSSTFIYEQFLMKTYVSYAFENANFSVKKRKERYKRSLLCLKSDFKIKTLYALENYKHANFS